MFYNGAFWVLLPDHYKINTTECSAAKLNYLGHKKSQYPPSDPISIDPPPKPKTRAKITFPNT